MSALGCPVKSKSILLVFCSNKCYAISSGKLEYDAKEECMAKDKGKDKDKKKKDKKKDK